MPDITKAIAIAAKFVAEAPFNEQWEVLVGLLLEPLGINASGHELHELCRQAADGIRGEWPESARNRPLWESRTGPWCRDRGLHTIIKIVRMTSLRMGH